MLSRTSQFVFVENKRVRSNKTSITVQNDFMKNKITNATRSPVHLTVAQPRIQLR